MNKIKEYAKAFAIEHAARYGKHYAIFAVNFAFNLLFLTVFGVELTTIVMAATVFATSIETQLMYIRRLLEGKSNG